MAQLVRLVFSRDSGGLFCVAPAAMRMPAKAGRIPQHKVQKAGQRDLANHRPLGAAVSWTHLGVVIGLGWPMRSVKQRR
jgi:hypothetical protein